ncbi:MAG TPA: ATP-binding cassette domain-containing protein [Chloroflexia bacterium]|nr:ATP-binding cassette domain-containing protein [Chloroflexia bacterium]
MSVPAVNHPGDTSDRPFSYAIEAAGLSKSYGKIRAVEKVDLAIKQGEIYALLGPNGAGKTTTINMLTTLVAPDGGSARVAGFDVVSQAAQVRRHIGVTFQETVIDKNLSGRTLLDIHGRLYKQPKAEIKARIEELVQLVELKEAIDRPVKTYSGGMKRRLELARGLMTRPQVLFLDEPTLGLDPHNRERIWTYIAKLKAEEHLTILVTTHYMEEAEKLADRVGIIDEGALVIEGTPAQLIEGMGADVVSVTGSGDPSAFVEALRAQEWVSFAHAFEQDDDEEDEPVVQAGSEPVAEAKAGQAEEEDEEPLEQIVQVGLNREAGRSLKPIINLAENAGFTVGDISIKRPNLNDVFFKHTGRRLRD